LKCFLGYDKSSKKFKAEINKYLNLLKTEITIRDVIFPPELININLDKVYKKICKNSG